MLQQPEVAGSNPARVKAVAQLGERGCEFHQLFVAGPLTSSANAVGNTLSRVRIPPAPSVHW